MAHGFFDVHANLHRRKDRSSDRDPPHAASATGAAAADAITVSQLTAQIDRALKGGLPAQLLVKGEVSNYKAHGGSGHSYFTLKDTAACVDCVMFRGDAAKLRFRPEDGMELLAGGRVGIYPQRGKYQLYVSNLTPLGQGALELALQQVRAKLEREGLFAAERKRPLPPFPLNLALVTSRQTAALQDMLKVLRRFPWLKLRLFHVPVQGDGSAEKIAEAIKLLNRHRARFRTDVILLGRGGGSLEDLWEFNEEVVARAIYASAIPVVTGIGHEIDTSIADLCADYFAHTPTEAAQVVTQQWRTVRDVLDSATVRLRRGLRSAVQSSRQRLNAVDRHEFFRRPLDRVDQLRQFLDDRQRGLSLGISEQLRAAAGRLASLNERLQRHRPQEIIARQRQHLGDLRHALVEGLARRAGAARERLLRVTIRLRECHPRHRADLYQLRLAGLEERLRRAGRLEMNRRSQTLAAAEAQLNALNPERVLRRGYSMTVLKKTGRIVKSAAELRQGDRITTRFADGTSESVVQDARQLPLFD